MKGIILAGGSGTRLFPLTKIISKQLLPVFNKPMIYYPLSTLMLSGIDEILIITNPESSSLFEKLLGDGQELGISIHYRIQIKPNGIAAAILLAEDFLKGEEFCLILGDNLIYGPGLGRNLRSHVRTDGATIFAYQVSNPQDFGIVEFDSTDQPIALVEKPTKPRSNWAIPGIYFYDNSAISRAKKLSPSTRGELEITDLNNSYLDDNSLFVIKMPRGTAWLDLGTPKSLIDAGLFIQTLEERQGIKIGDPYEIAKSFKLQD